MTPKRFVLILFALAAAALANAFLTGCAHRPKAVPVQFSAPAVVKVATSFRAVRDSLATAKTKAVEIAKTNNSPIMRELLGDLEQANADATRAQVDLTLYSDEVAKQTALLNTATGEKNAALEQSEYWHGKHTKGLREIWFWRIIAGAIIGAIAAWFALRIGIKIFL